MAGKFKKCRSPSAGRIDSWLDSLGYYRKNVAYDETCLFRAVSEQLFETQSHHERVRADCIEYGMQHHNQFRRFISNRRQWEDHLHRLRIHMVVCGNLEIELISFTYNVDVFVFNAAEMHLKDMTKRNLQNTLLLCKMSEDHYDVVYNKEEIITAGYCQSIVYKLLYENVFEIPNVSSIVNSMLHERPSPYTLYFMDEKESDDPNEENSKTQSLLPVNHNNNHIVGLLNPAPFPFKVAKALDPNMYRNIEYDSWIEIRRELRLGDWYYGDDKLILGTSCLIQHNGEWLQCYIQEILKEQNKCIVYVTKHAERRCVLYSDLKPESDAKAWPLPYRFSRNLVICPEKEGNRTCKKKNLKKRIQSCSESSNHSPVSSANAKDFEGCPLMQEIKRETPNIEPKIEPSSPLQPYEWNPPPVQITQADIPWSTTPTTQLTTFSSYGNTASGLAPVMIPPPQAFQDNTTPVYYNFSPLAVWSTPDYVPTVNSVEYESTSRNCQSETYCPSPQYRPEIAVSSSKVVTSPAGYLDKLIIPTNPPLQTTIPLTPTIPILTSTPQVEVYPYVYPVAPAGTPLYIQPPPTPRQDLYISPSPLPIYSPSIDLQYLSPPAYIYPPTPPATWYPPTSQGFVFPAPLSVSQNVPR